MIRRWLAALALMVLPLAAQAQTANPSLTAHAGGVRSDEAVRKITLQRLDTVVNVRGAVAETSVTAVFANPGNDILEGDFRFMLPEGAVVTGYALDVNGRMIEGVLVDQPKAKAVYEERVRQRVDPGLAEVTNDGAFKTRVFPIPPRGTRTIRLRFVAPLYASAQSDEVWLLPLSVQPGDGWSITVRSSDAVAPGVTWPGRAPGPMTRDGAGWIAKGEGKGELSGPLAISRAGLPAALLSRNTLGERFVQLSGASGPAGVGTAGKLRIYWDRSRSRLQGRHDDELALLRRTLNALQPRSIEIVLFNSSGAERKTVASVDAAIAALKAVRYGGASSFAALGNETAPADRCLLFSNGRPSIDRAATLSARCRLDAVTTEPDADMAWLRHVAASHGGRAFALGADGSAIEKALAAADAGVTGVFDASGRRLDFVPVESRAGRWMVIARAPASGGVTARVGSAETRIAMPEDPASFGGEGQLLAVDTLATLGASEQREAYVALSRRYSVASPSLSFLVLETPADYVNADIAPPEGYPKELLAQYREIRRATDDGEAKARSARLNQVAGMWAEQVAWWKRRFPASAPRPPKQEGRAVPVSAPMPAPTATPMAEPVPAPPPPTMRANGESGGDVVVTGARRAPVTMESSMAVTTIVAEDIGSLPDSNAPKIAIDAWQPDRPYLKAFDAAPNAFAMRFVAEEATHGGVPAFYLDTAEWLRKRGRTTEAVEMVTAALDLPSANSATYGIVAARLERYGAIDRAIELRERVAALEPDRPQPKRLLAL
ncbi:VIT domain-containing protein, partial [Sphingomonas sp. AOB5]|uniref:VIT domain-containing protein n=1 Tax=Sphingomonas sp. AOB5 TaxID=3034017 RepID=UPI0023F77943